MCNIEVVRSLAGAGEQKPADGFQPEHHPWNPCSSESCNSRAMRVAFLDQVLLETLQQLLMQVRTAQQMCGSETCDQNNDAHWCANPNHMSHHREPALIRRAAPGAKLVPLTERCSKR